MAIEEASISAGPRQSPSSDLTVADLFDRYAREISPSRSDPEAEVRRLRALSRMFGGKVSDLDAARIAEWRDARLREVSAASVNRDIGLLGAVFKRAMLEWNLPTEVNPAHQIIRPVDPPPRERRVSDAELDTVVRQLGWDQNPERRKPLTGMGRLVRQVRAANRDAPQRNSVHDLEETSSEGTSICRRRRDGDKRDDAHVVTEPRALIGMLAHAATGALSR